MKGKTLDTCDVLGHAFSITELAGILGRDRKTVAAIVRPLVPTQGSSKTRKNYTVKTLLQALDNPQDLDVRQMTPAERRAHWQAENERLKFEAACRELIPVDDCAAVYRQMVKATVMTLETLPDLLERDCALSPQATTYVQKVIDDFRDYLRGEVTRDAFGPDVTEENDNDET